MKGRTIAIPFRLTRRIALVKGSSACRTHCPDSPLAVWHRGIVTPAVTRRTGENSPIVPTARPNVLPEDWAQKMQGPPLTFLFHYAVSRIALWKRQLNDAQMLIHFAVTMGDPETIHAAYPIYAAACRHIVTKEAEMEMPWKHFQHAVREFVGPAIDLLSSTHRAKDEELIQTILRDFDSLWWPAFQCHFNLRPDAVNTDWYEIVDRLVRYGKRDYAMLVLLRTHTLRTDLLLSSKGQKHRMADLRPSWSLIFQDYIDKEDWDGIDTLIEGKLLEAPWAVQLLAYTTVTTAMCNLDHPPLDRLSKYFQLLTSPRSKAPNMMHSVAILRAALRLGEYNVAQKQANRLLFGPQNTVESLESSPIGEGLGGAAFDALIEDAIVRRNAPQAWAYTEKMVRAGQVPRQKNIQALVQLGIQPDEASPEIAVQSSDETAPGNESLPVHAAAKSDSSALRRVFRASAEDPSSAVRAIEIYMEEKARRGMPLPFLALPLVDRLCTKEELSKGGLNDAMKLFKEVADAFPTWHDDWAEHDRPLQTMCSTLMKALVVYPDSSMIRSILEIARSHDLGMRNSLVNDLVKSWMAKAHDHHEAMERLQFAGETFPNHIMPAQHTKQWVDAVYEDSLIPPVDDVLTMIGVMNRLSSPDYVNPAARLMTVLGRYNVLGKHVLAAFGDSEQGKKYVKELYDSLALLHDKVNNHEAEDSPLNHPTVSETLVPIYTDIMDCYLTLRHPDKALQIYETLLQGGILATATHHRALEAAGQLGDWKLAISLWTAVRTRLERGEFTIIGAIPRIHKVSFDLYCGVLSYCHPHLRTAAEAVQGNMIGNSVYGARARYLKFDAETAAFMLELADHAEVEGARDVMEKDFAEFVGAVFQRLQQDGHIRSYIEPPAYRGRPPEDSRAQRYEVPYEAT